MELREAIKRLREGLQDTLNWARRDDIREGFIGVNLERFVDGINRGASSILLGGVRITICDWEADKLAPEKTAWAVRYKGQTEWVKAESETEAQWIAAHSYWPGTSPLDIEALQREGAPQDSAHRFSPGSLKVYEECSRSFFWGNHPVRLVRCLETSEIHRKSAEARVQELNGRLTLMKRSRDNHRDTANKRLHRLRETWNVLQDMVDGCCICNGRGYIAVVDPAIDPPSSQAVTRITCRHCLPIRDLLREHT